MTTATHDSWDLAELDQAVAADEAAQAEQLSRRLELLPPTRWSIPDARGGSLSPAAARDGRSRRLFDAAPPPATIAPLMPKSFREVLRAVELEVVTPAEARYYYGLPTKRRSWWWSR
jgi:hypothetical protein